MRSISTQFNFSLELLESIIKDRKHKSATIVVCWPREEFFNQILQQIKAHGAPPDNTHFVDLRAGHGQAASEHSLLIPTLAILAASDSIRLVYCPSLPIARAYLSSFAAEDATSSDHQLVILDLVALHHGTSEFTLQGISRTLATVASAGHQTHSDVNLIECKDINDPTNPNRGSRLWDVEVPLLSGSIKIAQEGTRWAAKGIAVRKIAARWFSFEPAQRTDQKLLAEDENGEMIV